MRGSNQLDDIHDLLNTINTIKNMEEPNDRAKHIFKKMGVIDGKKHITQMLYLVKGINSLDLYEYWAKVEIEFKNLKHGY